MYLVEEVYCMQSNEFETTELACNVRVSMAPPWQV
jgi:hypothetical protein